MDPKRILWGLNIADVRKRLGMSQSLFAEKLGTRQSVVSAWERGAHSPNLTYVRRIVGLDPEHRPMSKLFPETVEDGLVDIGV